MRPVQKRGAFYLGRPCKRGHTRRYTSSGNCVECKRTYNGAYHERLYWGDGTKSFIHRASMKMRSRRSHALKRMAKRNEGRSLGALQREGLN